MVQDTGASSRADPGVKLTTSERLTSVKIMSSCLLIDNVLIFTTGD